MLVISSITKPKLIIMDTRQFELMLALADAENRLKQSWDKIKITDKELQCIRERIAVELRTTVDGEAQMTSSSYGLQLRLQTLNLVRQMHSKRLTEIMTEIRELQHNTGFGFFHLCRYSTDFTQRLYD